MLANNPPTTQQSPLIDTHMHDTDEQTTHTNMSGTSFDQTVKTMQSALTEIETLVESIQTQQRTSDAARQQADLARDEDLIRRETARDKLRMAEETKRRLDDEQRFQQTTRERQKDSNEHQAKLLEVEAKTTKLFEENIAQQQRTQEKHDLDMKLTIERFAADRADFQRQLKSSEEERRTYTLKQDQKFDEERIRINNKIADDKYYRDKEIEIAAEKTEQREAVNRARMEEVTARTDRKDLESREFLERLFQSLNTQNPLICDGTAASVSALTTTTTTDNDNSSPSGKRKKPGDNSTAMTIRMDSSESTNETNQSGTESRSDNYNPPDAPPRISENHDARRHMNNSLCE